MATKKTAYDAPTPATDKKKALQTALNQIEKNFGKGTVMRLGDRPEMNVDAIPTGSLALDAALGMVVEVIGEVLMPKYLAMIINFGAAYQELKAFSMPIFDSTWSSISLESVTQTLTSPAIWYMIGVCGMIVLTALLMMAGGIGGAYFGAKAAVYFASDIRRDVYSKVQSFSFANIDKFSTGSLVTRMTNDVTQIQNFVNMLLRMALRSPGMFIGGIVMAIYLKPSLSVILAVTMPLMMLTLFFLIRLGFPRFEKLQTKVDKLNSTVRENVTNVRVVKSFVREGFETEKFEGDNSALKNTALSAVKVLIWSGPVMNIFMYATVIAVIWSGHNIVLVGGMEIGDLSAFITFTTMILSSLMMVSMLFMFASRAIASGKRICEVLDEEIDINDTNSSAEHVVNRGDLFLM